MYARKRTPMAKKQTNWISDTYGIGDELDEWSKEIAGGAADKDRPRTEVPISEVFEEIKILEGEIAAGDWGLSYQRLLEAELIDKFNAIAAIVKRRLPPNRLRVNTKVFGALSDKTFQVEVKTVYEIDDGAKR